MARDWRLSAPGGRWRRRIRRRSADDRPRGRRPARTVDGRTGPAAGWQVLGVRADPGRKARGFEEDAEAPGRRHVQTGGHVFTRRARAAGLARVRGGGRTAGAVGPCAAPGGARGSGRLEHRRRCGRLRGGAAGCVDDPPGGGRLRRPRVRSAPPASPVFPPPGIARPGGGAARRPARESGAHGVGGSRGGRIRPDRGAPARIGLLSGSLRASSGSVGTELPPESGPIGAQARRKLRPSREARGPFVAGEPLQDGASCERNEPRKLGGLRGSGGARSRWGRLRSVEGLPDHLEGGVGIR